MQPAAGDGGSSIIQLYYQGTKIQPAAGDGGSSTKGVLPESTSNGVFSSLTFFSKLGLG